MFLRKDILLLLSAMLLLAGCGYDKEISKEEIAEQAGVEVDDLREYRLAFKHIVEEGKGKEEGPDLFEGKYRNPNKNDFKLSVQSGSPQVDVNYEL